MGNSLTTKRPVDDHTKVASKEDDNLDDHNSLDSEGDLSTHFTGNVHLVSFYVEIIKMFPIKKISIRRLNGLVLMKSFC